MNKDIDSLRAAYNAWAAAADFRTGRDRNKRFTYGDQWSDYVDDHNGGKMREFDLALHRGQRPLTNNLIRQLVKAIVGRYRNMAAEQKFYDMTEGSDADRNRLPDLDARMLEEFVISGCAVQRVVNECRVGGAGVWVDNVDCRRFFVNRFADPRGTDISLIGMMHDMSLPEIINRFGGGSLPKARELTRIFDGTSSDDAVRFMASEALGTASGVSMPFFTAAAGRCRVIELWTLDSRPVTVRGRMHMQFVWRQRWLAPDGTLLYMAPSPYSHGSHPFVVTMYPLTDGEVHSFVEDIIDQQRTVNRLVVMIDHMIASSAKGTLLFPVNRLARGMTLQKVAHLWSAPDAMIPIDGRGGDMPQQIVTNTADSGAYQALNLQMRLISEISGLSDAVLGRNVSGATGAELYKLQVSNASVTLTDLIETFLSFTRARNCMMAKSQ